MQYAVQIDCCTYLGIWPHKEQTILMTLLLLLKQMIVQFSFYIYRQHILSSKPIPLSCYLVGLSMYYLGNLVLSCLTIFSDITCGVLMNIVQCWTLHHILYSLDWPNPAISQIESLSPITFRLTRLISIIFRLLNMTDYLMCPSLRSSHKL